MRKLSMMFFSGAVAVVVLLHVNAPTANSRPQYNTAFLAKYVKADGTDQAEKDLAAAVKDAKCNVCHEGTAKKNRNAFGKELAKIFTPPNEKDPKKIDEAFEKVCAMHIDEKDPKSPTYGELIKKGKLPASESKPTAAVDAKTATP